MTDIPEGGDAELEKRVDELMAKLDALTDLHFPPGCEQVRERRAPDIRELLREDLRNRLRGMLRGDGAAWKEREE